jgi:hypothetical protein
MEGLFFVVPPLWWSWPVPILSLVIASMIAMIYVVYRFLQNMETLSGPKRKDYTFIAETDPDFAMRTLENLKEHLTYIHDPQRVTSHTVEEIRWYIENTELLALLDQLERAEYSKKPLTLEEAKVVNIFLAKMIQEDVR